MYKIIIVDDEEDVRSGIVNKLNWNELGFNIVGQAENGREALDLAEKTMPDVVITDITMPFMDGLTLAKELKKNYPMTKVILLTGYDDFKYAQEAIRLNVLEYVLKPVSAADLQQMLVRVKGNIDKEIAEFDNIKSLKEHYLNGLPILKEKFLASLISNGLNKNEIIQKSIYYNMDILGNGYIVSVLSFDSNSLKEKFKKGPHNSFEEELIKYGSINVCDEIIKKFNLGILFVYNEKLVLISILRNNDRDYLLDATSNCLEEIRQSIEKYLRFTITVGIGTYCEDITNINISYDNALSALDYRVILGRNRIIKIEDIEPKSPNKVIFDEYMERELTSCIKVGTEEEIRQSIDKLFHSAILSKASFKEYQIYLIQIFTTILKAAKESDADTDIIFGANYNLLLQLNNLKDIESAKTWFLSIGIKINRYIVKNRDDISTDLVNQAKLYVKENYSDCEITINKICSFLHISSAYFSHIFKKDTKTTFINYLTAKRMEAAKELLRTTNLKSFQIAEKVGYSEPNYFSYSFKKNFNISPSEYRNISKNQ